MGALLVHYSTDYVFDGAARRPYTEEDATAPLGAYGRSKLDAERRIRGSGAQALILRTAWVYAARGPNFLRTMQRLLMERDEVAVVDDQRGAPTWARQIAEATGPLLCQMRDPGRRDSMFADRCMQIYHLTCGGETTWFGFATQILAHLHDAEPQRSLARLRAIASVQYPARAARPAYSALSNDKLKRDFGLALPDWREALRLCLGN